MRNSNKSDIQKARIASHATGFTLIELMVVVAILAIIVAIAYPSYQEYILKSRRADAYNALLDTSNRQIQYFLDNKKYTANMTDLNPNFADPRISVDGYYKVDIDPANINDDLTPNATKLNDPPYFKLTATPLFPQDADKCTSLTLDSRNVKGAAGSTVKACWNN